MEIRYFNTWNGSISLRVESHLLITAHFIADFLSVGGEPSHALMRQENKLKLGIQEKIQLMYSYTLQEELTHFQTKLKGYLDYYYESEVDKLIQIQNNKNVFIAFKKYERAVLDFFEKVVDLHEQSINRTAYPTLRQITETSPIGTGLLELSRIAVSKKKPNPKKEAEKILQFMFAPPKHKGQPTCLFLNPFIMFDAFESWVKYLEDEEKCYSESTPPETEEDFHEVYVSRKDLTKIWFDFPIDLPSLNHLNSLELLLLKKQLKEPIAAFNQSANNWINCRNTPSPDIKALALSHVDLKYTGKKLEDALNNHPLCNTIGRGDGNNKIFTSLSFFYIRLNWLWDYFERTNFLQATTIAELKKAAANKEKYPECIPAMSITYKDDYTPTKDDDMENKVIGRKKSIDFD